MNTLETACVCRERSWRFEDNWRTNHVSTCRSIRNTELCNAPNLSKRIDVNTGSAKCNSYAMRSTKPNFGKDECGLPYEHVRSERTQVCSRPPTLIANTLQRIQLFRDKPPVCAVYRLNDQAINGIDEGLEPAKRCKSMRSHAIYKKR